MSEWQDPRNVFGDFQLSSSNLLPLQTQASAIAPPQTKPPDTSDSLPVVPQGNLRDALMGKFDDPEIPSGMPTEEQQKQAFTHRLIGNATGDVVANLQNTANILKPGAGNPHMADSSRQFGEMLAQKALGNAEDRRKEAIQNFQLKDISDQRHEKMYQMATALKQQRDMKDPTSELSRNAQAARSRSLQEKMMVTENPGLQQQFLSEIKSLPGATAEQIAAREKVDPSEKILEFDQKAQSDSDKLNFEKNKEAREGKRSGDQTSLGWANLQEQKREHDLTNLRSEENKSKLQLNEDKKAEEDITNLRNSRAELEKHLANLKSGTVDNDRTHVYANEGSKFASSLGIPIKPDAGLQDMLTSIPLAQATVEKAVTGSSRYSPQRWTQFAVQPGEGTQNSINKLSGAVRYLKELEQERMGQLHTTAAGVPTSQSGLAKALPPQAIPNAAAASQAKAVAVPGAIRKMKNGKQAQQQPDGTWREI